VVDPPQVVHTEACIAHAGVGDGGAGQVLLHWSEKQVPELYTNKSVLYCTIILYYRTHSEVTQVWRQIL
jgi:hypothetical protein